MKAIPPTADCRCWGCGNGEPMSCGRLCADCSWEDHLEHIAHTGSSFGDALKDTPACCKCAKIREEAEWADYEAETRKMCKED